MIYIATEPECRVWTFVMVATWGKVVVGIWSVICGDRKFRGMDKYRAYTVCVRWQTAPQRLFAFFVYFTLFLMIFQIFCV